jgi:hypothetical protein
MIRVILSNVDGIYFVDVFDTRRNISVLVERFDHYVDAATFVTKQLAAWQAAGGADA